MNLLLATGNAHKVEEIATLLRHVPNLEIKSLRDFPTVEMPEETGATMRENALIKAQSCAQQTGIAALADDSGIEVDILHGEPGVRSARWIEGSDKDRMHALLERTNQSSTRIEDRTARYRCAICVAFPDGRILETEGVCEGRIAQQPRGDLGFGYDPIFEITAKTQAPIEYSNLTMAQVPPYIKAQVSHRARAVAAMEEFLRTVAYPS
jgi:XTP/dITP diphosphohydrolase